MRLTKVRDNIRLAMSMIVCLGFWVSVKVVCLRVSAYVITVLLGFDFKMCIVCYCNTVR